MNIKQPHGQNLHETENEKAPSFFSNSYLVHSLSELLPAEIPIQQVRTILDIGCGTGEWACSLVQKYPSLQIDALDTSPLAIKQARERAEQAQLTGIHFQTYAPDKPLSLPDGSYDIVHIHALTYLIMATKKDELLDEIKHLLTPNGWLNIIDYDQGSTSSPAFNELSRIVLQGLNRGCGRLIPSTSHYSTGIRLYGLLVDSGLVDVSYTIHAVDYGNKSHPQTPQFLNSLLTGMVHFKPFLLELKLIESEVFDALVRRAWQELYQPYACGYAYLISALGHKDF